MKYLILLFSMIFFPMSSECQLKISVGGGANFTDVNITGFKLIAKSNVVTNYFVSVRPSLSVSKLLTCALDIQYSRKGYQINFDNVATTQAQLQYLDLLPQIELKGNKIIGVYAGMGVALRTSEKFKLADVWQESVNKVTSNTDITYLLGIRAYPMDKFSIHLQAQGSIKPIEKIEYSDSQGVTLGTSKYLLQNWQIGLAYQVF